MKLFTDCSIPFPLFVTGVTKMNPSVVIIEGEPITEADHEQIRQAWLDINSEYGVLIQDLDIRNMATDGCRLIEIGAKILRVKLLVEAARLHPMEGFLLELESDGYRIDASNAETLEQSFEAILLDLKADEIDYDRLNAKINAKDPHDHPDEKTPVTEADFDRMLVMINRNEKMVYKAADLTTRLFATLFADFKKTLISKQQDATNGTGQL